MTITHIFTILFLMRGPFKIIGPYKKITSKADNSLNQLIKKGPATLCSGELYTRQ